MKISQRPLGLTVHKEAQHPVPVVDAVHDAVHVTEAAEADTGLLGRRFGRWFQELGTDERSDLRGLVVRESRQGAILEDTNGHSAAGALLGGLNGLAAVTALYHGSQLLRSENPLHRAEGCNEVLMGVGCGLLAGQAFGGPSVLGGVGSGLIVGHGLLQAGIGLYGAIKGEISPLQGALQASHGACLVAAELCPSAALPLCAAMVGLTSVELYSSRLPRRG